MFPFFSNKNENDLKNLIKASKTRPNFRCSACEAETSASDMAKSSYICPKCGKYQRIAPRDRIALVCDKDSFTEIGAGITSKDFLDFPGNPIVPGVILCEILAQSACVLLSDIESGEILTLFTGLDKVRFKNQVKPGDTFCTECTITKSKAPFYFASGKGYVDGKLCVSAEFSFAVMQKNKTED